MRMILWKYQNKDINLVHSNVNEV